MGPVTKPARSKATSSPFHNTLQKTVPQLPVPKRRLSLTRKITHSCERGTRDKGETSSKVPINYRKRRMKQIIVRVGGRQRTAKEARKQLQCQDTVLAWQEWLLAALVRGGESADQLLGWRTCYTIPSVTTEQQGKLTAMLQNDRQNWQENKSETMLEGMQQTSPGCLITYRGCNLRVTPPAGKQEGQAQELQAMSKFWEILEWYSRHGAICLRQSKSLQFANN